MILAALLRPLMPRAAMPRITLYGHALNGNLLALVHEHRKGALRPVEFCFAGLDESELRRASAVPGPGVRGLHMARLRDAVVLARSDVVVTDRGAVTLEILKYLTRVPFIDVWHGVPYKGFRADGFRYLHRYREVWVSSPCMAGIYSARFGIDPSRIRALGYARTDRLVDGSIDVTAVRAAFGINRSTRCVLVAPTWQQDDRDRSVIPFGQPLEEFLAMLDVLGRRHNTLFLFRAHLNSELRIEGVYEHVRAVPAIEYPVVEELLAVSDILVTDWSSIAFDWLSLERPTVFLDVPPPFHNGFTLGPENRFGPVVGDLDSMADALAAALDAPDAHIARFMERRSAASEAAYGQLLDGRAAARQWERLEKWLV